MQRAEQAEVLLVGRDDLVAGFEPKAGEHGLAARRRGRGHRDLAERCAEQPGQELAHTTAYPDQVVEVRLAAPALFELEARLRDYGVDRLLRQRAERAGVEVSHTLEDGERRHG